MIRQLDANHRRIRLIAIAAFAAIAVAAIGAASGIASTKHAHAANSPKAHAVNTTGTITIGTTGVPGTLDPVTSTSGTDVLPLSMVFDHLIQRNPKTGTFAADLATSWAFKGAKKHELVVNLRHGVTFQDGTPFNAAAVVYYENAFLKAGDQGSYLQYVKSVTANGDYQVVYHLSQQNSQIIAGLADKAGEIGSPTAMQAEGKSFGTKPVGTGPYSFSSEVAGASYSFTRYDGYWNNAKTPRVQNIEIKIFQSDTALVSAIRSGEIDAAQSVFPQDIPTLKSDSKLTVASGPNVGFDVVYFDGAKSPMNNRLVRLAFNVALNRKAIVNAGTNGLGTAWTQPVPPGSFGYVKSLDPLWKYNPARAKQLVQQAGFPNGVNLTCYAYPGEGYDITAPIIIAEEKAAGINLKVIPGAAAQVAPFFTNKSPAQCFMAFGTSNGDPAVGYEGLWSKDYYNAGRTDFGVDRYYEKLRSTYTQAGQQKLYYLINKDQQTNPGDAILYAEPSVNVYAKNVGGWLISPITLDNWQGLYFKS